MRSLPAFLMKIAKITGPPEEGIGTASIIINRPYAHLEEELSRGFAGQNNVHVIVDRRYCERRTGQQPVPVDRRRRDRRREKEKLVEVVLSI